MAELIILYETTEDHLFPLHLFSNFKNKKSMICVIQKKNAFYIVVTVHLDHRNYSRKYAPERGLVKQEKKC